MSIAESHLAESRLKSIERLRRSARQIGVALHILVAAGVLALASSALLQHQTYPLFVCAWFFLVDCFLTYAFRHVDRHLDLLAADDRALDPLDLQCFEELSTRHPEIAAQLFRSPAVRRGRDLKLLTRAVSP